MYSSSSSSSDLAQKCLQIKEDDKFFSRLLSKESSMANPSYRVTVGVPFMWESQPGTPKYSFCEDTLLPPLTPPPSYFSNSSNKKKPFKKPSRSNHLIHILFSRFNPKKTTSLSPFLFSNSSSSSSSSTSSSCSSVHASSFPRDSRRFSCRGSSFDSRVYHEYDQDAVTLGSPTSTLCFGTGRGTKACYAWWSN